MRIAIESDSSIGSELSGIKQVRQVQALLYEGLYRFDKFFRLCPAQALTHAISNKGKDYVFNLRNTLWSNGKCVTAYDFENSWNSIIRKTPFDHKTLTDTHLKQEAIFKKFSLQAIGIYVLDEKRLMVKLRRPNPNFLALTASVNLLPMNRCLSSKEIRSNSLITNGPFYAKLCQEGIFRLVSNKLYWRYSTTAPRFIDVWLIKHITLLNKINMLYLFDSKFIDIIEDRLVKGKQKQVRSFINKINVYKIPHSSIWFLKFNINHEILKNTKIRQGLCLSLDRKEIAQTVNQDHKSVACSFIKKRYNKQQAKAAVSEARNKVKAGCRQIKIEKLNSFSIIYSLARTADAIASNIKNQWKQKVNIKINLYPIEEDKQKSLEDKELFEISLREHYFAWQESKEGLLRQLARIKEKPIDKSNSYYPQAIRELFAEKTLVELTLAAPLFWQEKHILMHDEVKGLFFAPNTTLNFE